MEDTSKLIGERKTLVGPFPPFNPYKRFEYPHELFLEWFQAAIANGEHEPQSMTLSTTDPYGFPDARILILKDIDENGWYFASSSKSKKGKQLEVNPNVALTFYWSLIGRQVRVRGKVMGMGKERSTNDFLNRGIVARAIALLDKQSSILEKRSDFDIALIEQLNRLKENPASVSNSWTLYRVVAKEVEFWQGNEERKHIRLKFNYDGEKWTQNLLWP
ncbi:pyridoxine/pyridoxamine 5'-phosphate oxidase [Metabacillus arenae]|uniref:Pyridoxal 5'-phosphate synthase n=1 Tax=Metabacillus arenae TaxID=2771434 RepID=A0A926RZ41_9BACI|nr:pyridoxal 5'-phosphate synthase [Metabacillus arenae]MBD1381842.1 pyridoxal 5'-phosphate synthase [Metabacillus arenae]